jgi:hypothetical protein
MFVPGFYRVRQPQTRRPPASVEAVEDGVRAGMVRIGFFDLMTVMDLLTN